MLHIYLCPRRQAPQINIFRMLLQRMTARTLVHLQAGSTICGARSVLPRIVLLPIAVKSVRSRFAKPYRTSCATTSAADGARTSGSSSSSSSKSSSDSGWRVKMLYDGDCPLCMREVDMLRRRDEGKGHIAFIDIAAADYDPSAHAGITFRQAMERIHAVLPDGTVLTDVEVFRRLYEEVGLGWVYAITQVPAVERAANAVYNIWAKYRLPVTGRPDLEVLLAEKRACGGEPDGACEIPVAKR